LLCSITCTDNILFFFRSSLATLLAVAPTAYGAGCPFLKQQERVAAGGFDPTLHQQRRLARQGDGGVPSGGYAAVREMLADFLVDSQDFFPADFQPPVGPNYGGLMIRLAWHCSGSFRESDGRGGCDGGRIRFNPELNWDDNANLNNALKLLEPIKEAFGSSLSWGDLIILAGNTAIETMGGPILGFCGGRIDDIDGGNSLILGPNALQEEFSPCAVQGQCQSPLGPTTVGLIYVNPAGALGKEGDPVASKADIVGAFAKMGFNDTESVALIGGGHAFGKCHGACVNPPCSGYSQDLSGVGLNTYTSGYEGAWTRRPTTWSNDYFHNLFDLNWVLGTGAGGKIQWFEENKTFADADIMMLTTDIALREGSYEPISRLFKDDMAELEKQFAHAWYRLTSADMGTVDRCLGDDVPPAQEWQHPLPEPSTNLAEIDFVAVRSAIQTLVDEDSTKIGAYTNLAYRCASTYRETDYQGGCNGARIRFSPEKDWESNMGTTDAFSTLKSVKDSFPDVSYADLIVLAGQTSVEAAGGMKMQFCAGRTDAYDAAGSAQLEPRYYEPAVISIRDNMQVKGLKPQEGVALFARPSADGTLSNQYFVDLKAGNGEFDEEEMALLESEFITIVDSFIADNETFLATFAAAWTYTMTADRFAGPAANACDDIDTRTLELQDAASGAISSFGVTHAVSLVLAGIVVAMA
jgi:catalase-peroxidase